MFGLGNKSCNFGGIGEQGTALWREGDTVTGAIKETYAEIFFQSLNLKSDGGLGEEEMFGGFAEVQMFGDGAEDFEAEVFELGHGMIIYGKGTIERDPF